MAERLVAGIRVVSLEVEGQQVVERLPPDHHPEGAVTNEDDRRSGHLVVGRRHRVAIGARDRRGEYVTNFHIRRHLRVADDHVAGFAVLTDDRGRPGRAAAAALTRNASYPLP